MPAGAYELRLRFAATGNQAIQLRVSVEAGEESRSVLLGATDKVVSAAGAASIVTVPWTSNGLQSFRVSIAARANAGSGQVLISAINATRIWRVVAGSPRYYEPSSAGQ
jgi:hypothetical protein